MKEQVIKLCKLCKINKAAIPDRNRSINFKKEICIDCHSRRLNADLRGLIK